MAALERAGTTDRTTARSTAFVQRSTCFLGGCCYAPAQVMTGFATVRTIFVRTFCLRVAFGIRRSTTIILANFLVSTGVRRVRSLGCTALLTY